MRTLVIGDAHVEAGEDLARFRALGNYIRELQPDNIVQIGDFITLDSLSAWDKNKRLKMEGRRFQEELDHARDALALMMAPIDYDNARKAKNKKQQYKPRMVITSGNHEDRFYRYLDSNPELVGVVDLARDIGFDEWGWETIPYRQYAEIGGVSFTHAPMNGMNQPLGGVYIAHRAALAHVRSVVFGHTHRLLVGSYTAHGEHAQQVQTVNVGCFFEGIPDYAKGSQSSIDWWRGVVILDHYGENQIDMSTYRLDALMGDYL